MNVGIYRHYKGKTYDVIGIAIDSDDGSETVVYRGLYDCEEFGKNPLFVRKKDIFLEDVEYNGILVPRFEYIGEK